MTGDGLARMNRDVPHDTALCVVALGANDMMQLASADSVRSNLIAILDRLRDREISALLCGMRAPPWFGAYPWTFDAIYPEVARATGTPLMPFLLEGVALHPAFVLPDRIHPNAVGVERIAKRLAPYVIAALDARPPSPPG